MSSMSDSCEQAQQLTYQAIAAVSLQEASLPAVDCDVLDAEQDSNPGKAHGQLWPPELT